MSRIVDRRRFLATLGMTASGLKLGNPLPGLFAQGEQSALARHQGNEKKPYGSGYFGEWIEDEFGLPAFHYECDQINDPKAKTEVNPRIILTPTEHIHQVGNDRVVAIASNYGHVRIRQDEGAPKFLNDYAPERGYFAGGLGYLTDGSVRLSTFYPGNAKTFDRIFGVGYFRKKVRGETFSVNQVIFAPFGDDPALVSQVTITNSGTSDAQLRWIEYWGCAPYQFSFRDLYVEFRRKIVPGWRRDLGNRFAHHFRSVQNGFGLLESKQYLGPDEAIERQWQAIVAKIAKTPDPYFTTVPDKDAPPTAAFEDLNPPPTFLVSLDGLPDGMSSNGRDFFGAGGASNPDGLGHALDGNLSKTAADSALLLERKFSLKPGESRTLSFLYGYIVPGVDLDTLAMKYRQNAKSGLAESSKQWKTRGLRFSAPDDPWVEREVTWNYYYLRSGFTYDDFFHQHIISQGGIYQYVWGFQGAARDPLQHVLPFVFSDPDLVKEVLRYTLKEVRPDGSIPYGIVGHGMPQPTTGDDSSDMPLWLLWAASEYILATRDVRFLDSDVVTVYGANAGRESVRNLLARCYKHLIDDVKTGPHGLMRMLYDDWNDALLWGWVPQALANEVVEKSESVLNSAMAAYVFDYYARMLLYAGDDGRIATPIQRKAAEHRNAVRAQWTGKWFRRAWLGPTLGWLGKGLWLEPQPWAILGGVCSEEQTRTLVQNIDQELRRPSPIGAMSLMDTSDQDVPHGALHLEPGTRLGGGVSPSLNQMLIWALAGVDGAMAWDEWKKNSFARHAEVYPEIWYGTWSGPDGVDSVYGDHPGGTSGGHPIGWTDFPVFIMHPHACPLYSLTKLVGVEFTASGVVLSPKLPLESYQFDSPLLGMVRSPRGYEGWYAPPAEAGTWTITLRVAAEEAAQLVQAEVNGARAVVSRTATGAIEIRGRSSPGRPLRWAVRRGR
jgi:Glycosyl hydrolase 36 superfamily, catalytic domain